MFDRILVGLDTGDAARDVTAQAVAMADRWDGRVDLLHVVEPGRRLSFAGEDADASRDRVATLVEAIAADAPDDVPVSTDVVAGSPADTILRVATERDVDVVVLGTQSRSGVSRWLLGSVTDAVLRRADRPVLVVPADPPTQPTSYDRILLPTDGSEQAELAAPQAHALASEYDATLDVVSVVDVQAEAGPFDAGGVSEDFVERLEADGAARVDSMLDRVRSLDADIHVETAVLRGRPHERLAEYVAEQDVDAIVMGAHGRSGFERGVYGSVTERVLRSVAVPVLIITDGE